tara:strand:- start:978 stop:2342 length:1365 start_codon:yes stop_codon:yes gene_type:complete
MSVQSNISEALGLGASATTDADYGQQGALRDILAQTSGSAANADKAIALANQLVPQAEEADPWAAAFKFFAEMGKQASKPGATVLGSAVSSMSVPFDYLQAKKAERNQTEQARLKTALSLGPSLKGPAGKGRGTPVKVVDSNGKVTYVYPEDAVSQGLTPYEAPKTGSQNNDLKPFGLIDPGKLSEIQRVVPNASVDAAGNVLLTAAEAAMAGVRPYIGQKVTPDTSDSGPKALTELAKLYDDLNAAEANSEEAQRIQGQIDAIAKASGYNKDIFVAEANLRKEWKKFESPFEEIQTKHKKLITALERQSGVGDMSGIFVYMKMLDPGSVVRESEFAQAQATAGAVETLIVKMNQIAVGDKLSPEQRAEFTALAEEFYSLSKAHIGQNRLDLGTIVSNNPSLKPSNIFGSEVAPASFYADAGVFRNSTSAGFTMDEVWKEMSDEEKADYLPSEG